MKIKTTQNEIETLSLCLSDVFNNDEDASPVQGFEKKIAEKSFEIESEKLSPNFKRVLSQLIRRGQAQSLHSGASLIAYIATAEDVEAFVCLAEPSWDEVTQFMADSQISSFNLGNARLTACYWSVATLILKPEGSSSAKKAELLKKALGTSFAMQASVRNVRRVLFNENAERPRGRPSKIQLQA